MPPKMQKMEFGNKIPRKIEFIYQNQIISKDTIVDAEKSFFISQFNIKTSSNKHIFLNSSSEISDISDILIEPLVDKHGHSESFIVAHAGNLWKIEFVTLKIHTLIGNKYFLKGNCLET